MKILIADDHELYLQGLELILRKEFPKAEIVLSNSYTEILNILGKEKNFDLIITDLAMPGDNWLNAIEKIHNYCPETPIAVISAVFDKEILQKTFDIGVSGYIAKSSSNSLILSAINLILSGGMYIPPELMQTNISSSSAQIKELIKDLENTPIKSESSRNLTPRQLEILQCLYAGLSNKQIANKLNISEGTIKIHITLLMRTLDVANRMQAVRKAVKLGILQAQENIEE